MAQTIGATAANSLALLGDTGTMYVDSATYLINIAAEYHKARLGARNSALVEVAASVLSVLALVAVTCAILADALARLKAPSGTEDVDPGIMLAFTMVNLVVDFAMCASIALRRSGGLGGCLAARCCRDAAQNAIGNRRRSIAVPVMPPAEDDAGAGGADSASHGADTAGRTAAGDETINGGDSNGHSASIECQSSSQNSSSLTDGPTGNSTSLLDMSDLDLSPQTDLNLCSAFAHVLADTLRTLTVMSTAVLVGVGGFDADRADAIGSLVVCAVIAAVALAVGYETLAQCRRLRHNAGGVRTVPAAEPLDAAIDASQASPKTPPPDLAPGGRVGV